MTKSRRSGRGQFRTLVGLPGVVYVLENDGLRAGWVKIGCSTRSGQARAMDLNVDANTGTPGAYRCLYQLRTLDCGTAEQEVFAALHAHRRGKWGQEFFEVELAHARATIERICAEVDGRRTAKPAASVSPSQPVRPVSVAVVPGVLANQVSTAGSSRKTNSIRPWLIAAAGVAAIAIWLDSAQRVKSPPKHDATPVFASAFPPAAQTVVASPQLPSPRTPARATHAATLRHSKADSFQRSVESGSVSSAPSSSNQQTTARQTDLSAPSAMEQRSIESACSSDRILNGPAAYSRCLAAQVVALENAPRNVDLSGLSAVERRSIESACNGDRLLRGAAAYNRCLTVQISELESAPRNVDLSGLNAMEQRSAESACSGDRILRGAAAYNRCLTAQVVALESAPRNVDLSGLGSGEQRSIKSACNGDRILRGPAAYNRCLTSKLDELGSAGK